MIFDLDNAIRRTTTSKALECPYLIDARHILDALRNKATENYGLDVLAIPCTAYERGLIEAGAKAAGENLAGWITTSLIMLAKMEVNGDLGH